jgi:hypothetical protein
MKVTKNILREIVEAEMKLTRGHIRQEIHEAHRRQRRLSEGWFGTRVETAHKLADEYSRLSPKEKVDPEGTDLAAKLVDIQAEFEGYEFSQPATKRTLAAQIVGILSGEITKFVPPRKSEIAAEDKADADDDKGEDASSTKHDPNTTYYYPNDKKYTYQLRNVKGKFRWFATGGKFGSSWKDVTKYAGTKLDNKATTARNGKGNSPPESMKSAGTTYKGGGSKKLKDESKKFKEGDNVEAKWEGKWHAGTVETVWGGLKPNIQVRWKVGGKLNDIKLDDVRHPERGDRGSSAGEGGPYAQDANTRPNELSSAFKWDPVHGAWWAEGDHEAGGEDYNLWIWKDGKNMHANGTYEEYDGDITATANESKSLSERLGMILSEVLELIVYNSTEEGDTLAIDMVGTPDPEEAETEVSTDESSDAVNIGALEEIIALVRITTLTTWTQDEFVQSLEDWIVNGGLGDNDYRKEYSYMTSKFEEKLDRLLNYDFSLGYGGNLSDFEKNDFKEKTGSTSLSTLKPNKLTKQALIQQLSQTDTSYANGRVDSAWDKFIGAEEATYHKGAAPTTSIKLKKSVYDETGVMFSYKGHEEFIILLAALKKLRRMREDLEGFSESSDKVVKAESLSYGRLQELAGILQG